MRGLLATFLALVAGCAAPPPAQPREAPPPSPLPSAPPSRRALPSATPSSPSPADAAPAAASVKLLDFRRVIEDPVHSLALGKGGRVAALGAGAWLDDGKGLRKLPAPSAPTSDVQIYFGRDDQPRLMGSFPTPHQRQGVYARLRKGAWERGASEIGKLGTAPMPALFGVLGYDDPEVVCGAGQLCIIKRKTGWQMIPPTGSLPRVELSSGEAWAFEGPSVWHLEKAGWRPLEPKPSFARASHLWAVSTRDIWLAEREADRLHHFDGTAWTASASPVKGPRSLWATGPSDVWLAADGGVGHFDGKAWSRVESAAEQLSVVTGRSASEVWLAGESGAWRGRP